MAKNYFNTIAWANMLSGNLSVRFAPNVTMDEIKNALRSCDDLKAEIFKSRYKTNVLVVRGNLQRSEESGELGRDYWMLINYHNISHMGDVLEIYEPGYIRDTQVITRESISAKLMLIRKGLAIIDVGGKLFNYESLCDMGMIVPMESAPTGSSYFEMLYDDDNLS